MVSKDLKYSAQVMQTNLNYTCSALIMFFPFYLSLWNIVVWQGSVTHTHRKKNTIWFEGA